MYSETLNKELPISCL